MENENEKVEVYFGEEQQESINQPDKKPGAFTSTAFDVASILTSSVLLIMILFTFFLRLVGVSGPSMMQTLHDGDKLLVTAFLKNPDYGDVVIITQPNAFNEPIVKRVIALSGDKVYIDFDKAEVYVNDKLLNEPYINTPTTDRYDWTYPITVPEGKVFVMGDNRQHSTDSRSAMIGLIDKEYILGKAFIRIFPFGSFSVK